MGTGMKYGVRPFQATSDSTCWTIPVLSRQVKVTGVLFASVTGFESVMLFVETPVTRVLAGTPDEALIAMPGAMPSVVCILTVLLLLTEAAVLITKEKELKSAAIESWPEAY